MTKIALPVSDAPRASILVLSRRNPNLLRACLTALARNVGPGVAFEVIVLLNGADQDVAAFCDAEVLGARVERSPVNLGFPAGTNRAAALARGEYLVLLNDDTEVEPGWLEALVEAADRYPEAAAIGSRILFGDRSVQEAGAVIWQDGTTAQVGRGLPETSARHLYPRRVDYCSAASLLVRRGTWSLIGGFDEEYFPGYYEDVDLCLAIRERGEQILYEPRSRVVHHESATLDRGLRTLVGERNVGRLRSKWSAALSVQEPAGPGSSAWVERGALRAQGWPRRILIVGGRLPDLTLEGRMAAAIRALRTIPAVITVHAEQLADDGPHALAGLGCDIIQLDLLDHLATAEVFYDAAILCRPPDFPTHLSAIRERQPQAAVIYAEGLAAAAATQTPEARIVTAVDRVVSSSEDWAALVRAIAGHSPVEVVEPGRDREWIGAIAQARSRRIDEYV